MSEPEFPPNSETAKKNIERVTTGEVTRKKKSLRKQFSETFVAGDMRTAVRYMMFDVLLPAAKDMVVDAGSAGIEKLIFGDSRRRRGSTPPQAGATGYVSYNRYSSPGPQPMGSGLSRAISPRARARHDFDEIVLDSRSEAEQVIDQMFDIVSRYEVATVADLYQMVGLGSSHTDHKWGWTDLRGSGVSRIRDGYLLDLPDPEPLD